MDEDTLVSTIITQAFREGNFTALKEDPTAEELVEAEDRLRNLINSVFGLTLGELQRDWYVPQEPNPEAPLRRPLSPDTPPASVPYPYAYLPANVRLLVNLTAARTLFFPASPSDGARMSYLDMGTPGTVDVTLDGNGRLIEGAASLTSDADAATPVTFHGRRWLYRADRGEWVLLSQITTDGRVPTPPEFDTLWITGLTMSLAPRYEIEIQSSIAQQHAYMIGWLKKRYKQREGFPAPAEMSQHLRESGI